MEKASFLINDVKDHGECRGETLKLENIIEELHFIDEVEQAVLKKLSSSRRPISEIAETAYKGDHFDFPICKRMPLTRLCKEDVIPATASFKNLQWSTRTSLG